MASTGARCSFGTTTRPLASPRTTSPGRMAELAIRRGGHVRVGLEDYAGPGEPSNLDLLRAAVALISGLGHAPASTAQARQILGVPPATRSPLGLGN